MKRTKQTMTATEIAALLAVPCQRDNARLVARVAGLRRRHAASMNEAGVRFLAHVAQALMR